MANEEEETSENEKKKKKKRKKSKDKGREVIEATKDKEISWKEGKIDKNRKGRKSVTFADSYPFDQSYRDDCVTDILHVLFEAIEKHIADKPLFPKYLAHAVSRTVAQMVQMVCYSHSYWMDTWKLEPEGGAIAEWDLGPELELPPIDTWARAIIPMKLYSMPVTFLKPPRSASGQFRQFPKEHVDPAISVPKNLIRRRASATNIITHKTLRKCDHCSAFDKAEAGRRKSDDPHEIKKQRKKMLEGVVRRLSSMYRDQAMLNQILKAKGLLPLPKPGSFCSRPPREPPYFEGY